MDTYPRITDIPSNDVILTLNKKEILDIKNSYKLLEELIFSGNLENAQDSVINWILAYNADQKYDINVYNISQIIRASNDELLDLGKQLGSQNKNDIIQILTYLNKLKDDFALLPDEILMKIMAELNYDNLMLLSKTSKRIEILSRSKIFIPILERKLKEKLYLQYASKYSGFIRNGEFYIIDKEYAKYHDGHAGYILCDDASKVAIMWEIGVKIHIAKLSNKNFYITYFLNNKYRTKKSRMSPFYNLDKAHFEEWDLDKLAYYHAAKDYTDSQKCDLIKERMLELDAIEYEGSKFL